MKFLLDVCVSSRSLSSFLADRGHDVVSVLADDPTASDAQILEKGRREQRIIVTADKDFGELVFVKGLPHGPIVRLVELTVDQQVEGMHELLNNHAAELRGQVIVTVSRGRIRIRR